MSISFARDIVYGAPSTQYWTELSSAIAGGLCCRDIAARWLSRSAMLMLSFASPRAEGLDRLRLSSKPQGRRLFPA